MYHCISLFHVCCVLDVKKMKSGSSQGGTYTLCFEQTSSSNVCGQFISHKVSETTCAFFRIYPIVCMCSGFPLSESHRCCFLHLFRFDLLPQQCFFFKIAIANCKELNVKKYIVQRNKCATIDLFFSANPPPPSLVRERETVEEEEKQWPAKYVVV